MGIDLGLAIFWPNREVVEVKVLRLDLSQKGARAHPYILKRIKYVFIAN
jgi:hypothetical protein